MLIHPIQPIFDNKSEILILGSFPSVRSREEGFFYGHPQNRFWRVVAAVFDSEVPVSIEEKKTFLLTNHIAIWDVIGSCDIEGSADSTIRNVSPNDLKVILDGADIRNIYVNGKTAYKYYRKYTEKSIGRTAICLPSTSPANAAYSVEQLIRIWSCIRKNEPLTPSRRLRREKKNGIH